MKKPSVLRAHRPVLLLFFAAVILRLLCAVLVLYVIIPKGIFPSYYFGDSTEYQKGAFELLKNGIFSVLPDASSGHIWYMRIAAFFYSVFGPRLIVMMCVNAFLSSVVVFLIYKMGLLLFNKKIAFGAALVYTAYPSMIFFGCMDIRDPWIAFFSLLACTSVLAILNGKKNFLWVPVFFAALFAASLLRPQTALFFLAAIVLSLAGLLAFKNFRPVAGMSVLIIASGLVYKLTNLSFVAAGTSETPTVHAVAVPEKSSTAFHFLARVVDFRYNFLYSNATTSIPPSTLLFPDWRFHSVFGLMLMELKLVLYVLFMPLPFIYPEGGRIARLLQGVENTAFLTLFALFVYGLYRAVKTGAIRASGLFIFIYIAVFIGIWSFFCPDLGSATRYKLQYIPLMLPFMASGWDIIFDVFRRRAAGVKP